jgi:serine/threonine protein kinase
MITFLCTHCGKQLRIRPDKGLSAGVCPNCKKVVEVPQQDGKTDGKANGKASRETLESDALIEDTEIDFLRPAEGPGELGRLGDYRVLRILGAGSMGIVFEAEDIKLHRRVALKVMKKAQAKREENRGRFMKEARSAAAIEHDHIVTIYQVGEDAGFPFLAMKLLVGESLEDRLNRVGPLPPEEVIRIGTEIADGLAAAHERGLIHRDIKPANIWLEEGKGRVKIVDFGLARVCDDEEAAEAERNYLIGTPLYMSPEQARGLEIDQRSDLFSLGSLLYRISTGKLPFPGTTSKQALLSVIRDHPMAPRAVNSDIPPFLSRVIMDLLEKAPGERPRNARVVITQLEEALQKLREAPPEEEEEEEEIIVVAPEEIEKPKKPKRKPTPPPQKKGKEEPTLEGRVIWWAIFAGVCVFLLLAFLIGRHYFLKYFKKPDEARAYPAPVHRSRHA